MFYAHITAEMPENIVLRLLLCRFKDNPLVTGAPHIRFYAGAPLVTSNGMRLGSLCVIDVEPRNLDAEQLMVLANFAEVVVREIEKDIARVRLTTHRPPGPGTMINRHTTFTALM